MAEQHLLPLDVYQDALTEFLLLNAFERLLAEQTGVGLPPTASHLSYNDILAYAAMELDGQAMALLYGYAESLSMSMPALPGPSFPPAAALPLGKPSPAEICAWEALSTGGGSLWSGVRQALLKVDYEKARHGKLQNQFKALSFTVGACSRAAFIGISKHTAGHPNLCRLLSRFMVHLLPHHKWTTLAIHVNCQLPVHRDTGSGPADNALVARTPFEGGELWLEDEDGTVFQEHEGKLLKGRLLNLQNYATTFPASRVLHCTERWGKCDRVTMVAYTVRNYYHLGPCHREHMASLGFCPPPESEMPVRRGSLLLPPMIFGE
mmetsp:Transcript_110347/g.154888  ORF Transcript_110347/g.154888 Transcript_110347/m.154888 type:complete len:321 (-) Transcript_110347:248-1210(-)